MYYVQGGTFTKASYWFDGFMRTTRGFLERGQIIEGAATGKGRGRQVIA